MNRPRKAKGPYPPCFYAKHGAFYLVKANKWTRLGDDLATALAEYGRLMSAPKQGEMAKLIDAAMPSILRGKADNTKLQYDIAANTLKRKLIQFAPPQVTSKTVSRIQASMAETPNMANRVISVLRSVFDYAVANVDGVESNPCVGIKRLPEHKRTRLLSAEEWHAIHDQADARLKLIMEMQLATGQRISDVLSIRRSQISDDGIVFKQKKTGAQLLVRWSPDLLAIVEAAKALTADRPTLTLFRGRYGGAPNYTAVSEQWAIAVKAAGVEDARLNDGRAMSATATKRQGKDAQALLGHATPAMTKRYLRARETPEVDGPSFRQALDVGQKS